MSGDDIELYSSQPGSYSDFMNVAEPMTVWIVGLVIAGLLASIATHHFTPEARERRRCRRNHRKVVTRARRPMVMLSAKVGKA